MIRRFLCRIGFHKYMDLQRHDETMGQSAVEECIHCGKAQSVFRLMHFKEGPMHPRVEAAKRLKP